MTSLLAARAYHNLFAAFTLMIYSPHIALKSAFSIHRVHVEYRPHVQAMQFHIARQSG